MKLRLLLLILIILGVFAGGCAAYTGYFIYMTPLSVDGCLVTVNVAGRPLSEYYDSKPEDPIDPRTTFGDEDDAIEPEPEIKIEGRNFGVFYRHSNSRYALDISELFDVGESDVVHIDRDGIVHFTGQFNVSHYVFFDDRWYFQILADGDRSVFSIPSLFGDVAASDEKVITDNGWVWVDGIYVDEFDPTALELECEETGETIDLLNPAGETVEPFYLCRVTILIGSVPGHVGPDEDRPIRAYVQESSVGYGVKASHIDDQNRKWYEIVVPDIGNLWVLESLTFDTPFIMVNEPNTSESVFHECDEIGVPVKEEHPILLRVGQPQSIAGSLDTRCDQFVFLAPVGSVPLEPSYYEWTRYEGAEEYILSFFNYENRWVASLTIDGSLNRVWIETAEYSTGGQLKVDVTARINGNNVCTATTGSIFLRAGYVAPPPDEPEPTKEKKKDKKNGGYTPPETIEE